MMFGCPQYYILSRAYVILKIMPPPPGRVPFGKFIRSYGDCPKYEDNTNFWKTGCRIKNGHGSHSRVFFIPTHILGKKQFCCRVTKLFVCVLYVGWGACPSWYVWYLTQSVPLPVTIDNTATHKDYPLTPWKGPGELEDASLTGASLHK